jgi:hypothetical protein
MLNNVVGLLNDGVIAPLNSYESIATINGTGSSGTITFSSIPATYSHLQIRGIGRSSQSANYSFTYLRLNADTGSNYSAHELVGNGSAASAAGAANSVWGWGGYSGAQTNSNNFGVFVIDILDYANTNKYKTVRSLTGYDANGVGAVAMESTGWRNTAAVTSVSLILDTFNFSTGTTFALYGIKG